LDYYIIYYIIIFLGLAFGVPCMGSSCWSIY